MKNLFFLLSIVFWTFSSSAQYAESIRSGRPGQSIGPFTVGKNIFQVQAGIELNRASVSHLEYRNLDQEVILRLGLLENFEIGAGVFYGFHSSRSNLLSNSGQGLRGASFRFRYHIITGEGWIPSVCVQNAIGFPISSEITNNLFSNKTTIATSNKISDKLGLITNWSWTFSGDQERPDFNGIINLGYGITDRISVFAEMYGELTKLNRQSNVDGGVAFLVNPNLQLDVFAGTNLSDNSFFTNVGISWRTKRKQ